VTVRVLVGKVGLDGHDRGVKVVARILRDAGIEVIYGGLRLTPADIAAMANDEDVDVIGLSLHNGAHLTIAAAVIAALRERGMDTPVVIGGIVPTVDIHALSELGVAAVLRPGTPDDEVVSSVLAAGGAPRISRT
jgi:methylmalonyl-CoA mutase, C-terminal domain